MLTRSQTKRTELPVNIDFDHASKAWNRNKIRLGNGTYKYKKLDNLQVHSNLQLQYNLRSRDVTK